MGFDLMDVFVKIGADTSGLESGINNAKGLAGGLGSAITGGMKVVGGAIAGATAAVGGFAASAVSVGANFDSSMAQVAATMGVTVDEIGELRQFAQDMGATTAFSATQAADALNYMALAGYDADESMQMLPNVLNLAAAGDMELARASDMVTDAQTALGLSFEETSQMVDMMAKTASKSNTSVEQMGDAILTVGGTAKSLAGGTNELSTALGLLADNGIKGSEGGTKLRNVILSLSAPTDKAAKMLNGLGVSTADAEGNLRPLEDIMGELGDAMDGLGSTERADIISTIFNKTDIAAVNALLDTSSDRWEELSGAISDSAGAAEDMANTQLDNLNGDITLFKSALEGAQILISDALTPSLREFVQFGTEGLTKISDGFKEGGLSGAMDAFGEVLTDGIGMITEMIPQAVDAGIQLLGAVGQGLIDNAPAILDALVEVGSMLLDTGVGLMQTLADGLADFDWAEAARNIINFISNALTSDSVGGFLSAGAAIIYNLVSGILDAAPELVTGAADLIQGFADGIKTNLPKMVSSASDLVKKFGNFIVQSAPKLLDAGIKLLMSLVDGIIASLPTLITTAIELIVTMVAALIQLAPKLLAAGVELIVKLVAGIVQTIPALLLALADLGKRAIAKIKSIDWIGLGKNVITFIVNGIKALIDLLPTTLKNIATKAIEWVKSVDWIGLGKKIINTVVNGVKALVTLIPTTLKNIAIDAIDAVKSIDWLQLGKDIINGVVDGLKSLGNVIMSALLDMANEAWSSVKKFFGGKKSEEGEAASPNVKNAAPPVITKAGDLPDYIGSETTLKNVSNNLDTLTPKNTNIDAENNYYETLADAIVSAFLRANVSVECDNREFGRLVRKLGVV